MTDEEAKRINDEAIEKLLKEILSGELGTEYKVVIESPFAKYVEYGTTPAKKTPALNTIRDPEAGDMVTLTRLHIRDWAARKYNLSGAERVREGDKVYKHVMRKGMTPHPFIRPAIRDMEYISPEDIIKKYNEGAPPAAIFAEHLADRMRYYLRRNRTDGLVDRVKVKPVEGNEVDLGESDIFDPDEKDKDGRGAF